MSLTYRSAVRNVMIGAAIFAICVIPIRYSIVSTVAEMWLNLGMFVGATLGFLRGLFPIFFTTLRSSV